MVYNWFSTDFVPTALAYSFSFIALLIGSITDLKTREVPDWVNYGLIFSGLGLNFLFSAIYSTPHFAINSIVGLLIFFGIAYIMFYAGQWGGGDSKILMGLGAMIGLDISLQKPQFLLGFFINALFAGAIYGLLWSIFLVFKNRKRFWKEFKKILSQDDIVRVKNFIFVFLVLIFISLFFVKLAYIKIIALSMGFLVITTFYLWAFVKTIEKSFMYKRVEPSKLTEGDWIVKNIYVDGMYVTGPKDLGVGKAQIRKLAQFYKQKKVRKILIKEGIPFVPSFLMSFVITLIFGNPLVLFFR